MVDVLVKPQEKILGHDGVKLEGRHLSRYEILQTKFDTGTATPEESKEFIRYNLKALIVQREALADINNVGDAKLLDQYLEAVSETQELVFTAITGDKLVAGDFRDLGSEVGKRFIDERRVETDARKYLGIYMPYAEEEVEAIRKHFSESRRTVQKTGVDDSVNRDLDELRKSLQ